MSFMENRRQDPTLLWQVFGLAPQSCFRYPGWAPAHLPSPTQHFPLHLPATSLVHGGMILSIVEWLAHCCKACYRGPGTSLQHPPVISFSPPSYAKWRKPPRKSTCTMSEGDPGKRAGRSCAGTPLSSPAAPTPPRYPRPLKQCNDSIQFSFTHQLPLENGSHHPGRPPSCLCLHPLPQLPPPPSRD